MMMEPPNGGIGDPDLFLMTSSACSHYFKWWDTLKEIHQKPLVFVNTPRVMDPSEHARLLCGFRHRGNPKPPSMKSKPF
jgi:hypothetical protein